MIHPVAPEPELHTLDQARGVVSSLVAELQQARWRIGQLEKELYGPSSERCAPPTLSKEQILLSLFPAPAEPPATQTVLLPAQSQREARPRRQPVVGLQEQHNRKQPVRPHIFRLSAKPDTGCQVSRRILAA